MSSIAKVAFVSILVYFGYKLYLKNQEDKAMATATAEKIKNTAAVSTIANVSTTQAKKSPQIAATKVLAASMVVNTPFGFMLKPGVTMFNTIF